MSNRFRLLGSGPKVEVTVNGKLPPEVIQKLKDTMYRAKAEILRLEKELKDSNQTLVDLIRALDALAHPDGVIRGPLVNGPELDHLNEVIAKAKGKTK